LFIVMDANSGKWRVTNVDVSSGKTTGQEIAAYVEELLNSAKGRTILEAALAQNKDIYYEPNVLSRPKYSYFVPPGILTEDEKLCSQAVFMMRAGEVIVGALSLDFVITNALSPSQRELLGYFACWLGKLILQDDSLKDLSSRVELLEGLQSFTDMLSRTWHSSEGQLYSLRNLCEACLHDQNVKDKTELHDNLSKLQIGIEQISGMPSKIAALARVPIAENVNTGSVWQEITNDLSAKAKHLNVLVEKKGEIDHVWADKDILWMILYHLLDNALDACKEQPERKAALRSRKLSDTRVELCVADSGKGIASSEIDHVMDLGYTTKGHGIGYGLFWVKQRVLDMQGEFNLTSAGINMGACAIIVLDAPKY
ncbi:MAG: sensor histidine kinase, partial [Syntrophales bacterium]